MPGSNINPLVRYRGIRPRCCLDPGLPAEIPPGFVDLDSGCTTALTMDIGPLTTDHEIHEQPDILSSSISRETSVACPT